MNRRLWLSIAVLILIIGLGVATQRLVSAQSAPSWEYLSFHISPMGEDNFQFLALSASGTVDSETINTFDEGTENQFINEWLNKYGRDGWELTAVTNVNNLQGHVWNFYFKRQAE